MDGASAAMTKSAARKRWEIKNLFVSAHIKMSTSCACWRAGYLSMLRRTSRWCRMMAWPSDNSPPILCRGREGPAPWRPLRGPQPCVVDTCLVEIQPSNAFVQLPGGNWLCLQWSLKNTTTVKQPSVDNLQYFSLFDKLDRLHTVSRGNLML